MPRKKDGMLFELLPRPTKGEDGKPLLYARPAIGFKYNLRAIDDFCHKYRGMSKGEMNRLFTAFLDVATILMRDGSRIETPIGSFVPKLKLNGDFTEPMKVKPRDVSLATIEFTPSKLFVEELDSYLARGFRQKQDPVVRRPLHELREEGVIEETLKQMLKRRSFTIKTFAYYSGMKYPTALVYLNNLCKGEKPLLRKSKVGTTSHYFPLHPEEEKKE